MLESNITLRSLYLNANNMSAAGESAIFAALETRNFTLCDLGVGRLVRADFDPLLARNKLIVQNRNRRVSKSFVSFVLVT